MLINFRHENKIDESLFFFKKAIQTKPSQGRLDILCMMIYASINS